ncbi:MAG TPA: VWA-like domain-containing protein [Lachnospiraceae bacterium]
MEIKRLEKEELVVKLESLGEQILFALRDELYLSLRYLDVALCSFYYQMDTKAEPFGTDGVSIFYHPQYLGGLYKENRIGANRAYLHMVLHCLFRHWEIMGRNRRLWDIACDVAVEHIIDSMDFRVVKKAHSMFRKDWYRFLEAYYDKKVLHAQRIYEYLAKKELSDKELLALEAEFRVDDHSYWKEAKNHKNRQTRNKKWQDISEKMETDLETFSKEAAQKSGALLGQIKVGNRRKKSYKEFLRKFMVLKEEIGLDMDSFDPIYYTYGLTTYKNMPLVEPMETKEVKRIRDLVIVIDTSMSTSGNLVRKFLEESYGILKEIRQSEGEMSLHIMQCDEAVQSDVKIKSEKDLDAYMQNLTLYGQGGTDFRPAFTYINEKIKKGELQNLQGILYFTDGYGIYPKQKPTYETAFIFFKEDYQDEQVPAWAIKLILEESDL